MGSIQKPLSDNSGFDQKKLPEMQDTRVYRKNNYMLIQKKRMGIIGISFIIVYGLLLLRLFYIQVYMGKSYAEKAVRQRMIYIPISTNRGIIYDRNMIPITDREVKKVIIVYPAFVHDKKAAAVAISKACNITGEAVEKKIEGSSDTIEFLCGNQKNEYLSLIESGRIKGVIAVEKRIRYAEDGIAEHVVGYIGKNDKIGHMGI